MQPIQEGSTGQLLRERFKLTGQIQPVLDETVSPVVVVGDLELGSLPVVRRVAVGQALQAAVVGQLSSVRFKVPAGIVAKITTVRLNSTSAAGLVTVHFGDNLVGPFTPFGTAPEYADGRVRGTGVIPASSFDTSAEAAITAPIILTCALSPGLNSFAVDWPVGGRNVEDHVEFQLLGANQQLRVVLEWIEYLPF